MVKSKLVGMTNVRKGLAVLFYKPLESSDYDYVCAWTNGADVWGWTYHRIETTQTNCSYIRKDGLWVFLEDVVFGDEMASELKRLNNHC